MDISSIARTGRIEVDAVKLAKVLRREYIRYTFRKNIHMLISVYHWFKEEDDKDPCDIITPLNTYNNVDYNTVCFYDKHITFKYEDGVTVEVAASTAHIEIH